MLNSGLPECHVLFEWPLTINSDGCFISSKRVARDASVGADVSLGEALDGQGEQGAKRVLLLLNHKIRSETFFFQIILYNSVCI